ncbi:MAG: acyl--CoA ligase [Bacteroidetes bacterium]|nr:acyl--CoA ligase [Bacteroidota bacterium]
MPDIRKKIKLAHSTSTAPAGSSLIKFPSIGGAFRFFLNQHPDKPFLTYFEGKVKITSYTFEQFDERCRRFGRFLTQAGIKQGDRIATAGTNHPDLILLYFTAWRLGLSVVPINLGEDDHRLHYILEHAKPKLVAVLNEDQSRIKSLNPSVPVVETGKMHAQKEEEFTFDDALNRRNQEAFIVYTSGTTGNPKGVILNQVQLLVDSWFISDWHNITPADRFLCVLPVHHVNGTVVTHLTPLMTGSSIVLLKKFSDEAFFDIVKTEEITISSVVPTLLQFLIQSGKSGKLKATKLRHLICGAGPLTVELALKFEDKFEIPVIHGYGLSETTCYSCFLPVDQNKAEHRSWLSDYGFPSIGVPLPCNEMDIQDDYGKSLPEGEKGEIVIRGHNVMDGYFLNPDANKSAFEFGWFRSGDEGFFKTGKDGQKYFFITGRFKELIIRGGVNLSPLEIDEVIGRCPGVKAGIAVGFENDWYGEEVGALVVKSDPDLTETEVLDFCKTQLPFSKSPKVVLFTDSLPVTSTGKYQRNKVKLLFAEFKETQFRGK